MTHEVNTNSIQARPFDPRLFLTDQELDRGVALILMAERALILAAETARREAGLSRAHMQIMIAIRQQPEQTVTALREHLGLTVPTFARQIAILDQRGLIERRPARKDGRARQLVLSDAGMALTTPIAIAMRNSLREAWRKAGAENVAGARIVLETLTR